MLIAIKGETVRSWDFISRGYKLNPNNLDLIARLQYNFIDKMKYLKSSDNSINKYDSLLNEYPALRSSVDVLQMGGSYHLNNAERLFYQNNYAEGEKSLTRFENFLKKNTNCKLDPDYIARVYGYIASAYFRKNDIKKCKTTIERGLVLVPDNEQLIRKYKINITREIR